MAREESISVVLQGSNGTSTPGTLTAAHYTKSERIKHAFLRGGFAFCGTIVVLFVPIAHFFLVPIGLLTTLILVSKSLNQEGEILSGNGTCPFCGKDMTIVKRKLAFPFQERCDSCSRESSVRPT